MREAIRTGVAKVNYGTILKQRYLAALRDGLDTSDDNPHHLLGYGGDADIMTAGRIAVRGAVVEKMKMLGSSNRG